MNILSGLFKSRDKPTNSLNGSGYRFFFGGSNSGKAVNEKSAMQMTAVYACVRILSESIAGLPVHIYKYTDSGSKEKAIKHPLYRLIHDDPNPEMTSFVFRGYKSCICNDAKQAHLRASLNTCSVPESSGEFLW